MAATQEVTTTAVARNTTPGRVIPIDWLYDMLSPAGQRKYVIEHEQVLLNRLREQRALTPAA